MQVAALFLLLLLPPAETTGEMAAGLQASLRQQLGDVAMAIAPDTLVTPAMWRGPKAPMRARFVARIAWTGKDKLRVELLAAETGATGLPSRELAFSPRDDRRERGRALGLVLAELLRESPASAFTAPAAPMPIAAASATTPHLAFGAAFATERAFAGHWAMGPKLSYGFGLGHALWIEARGVALFADDQYSDLGFGMGLRWDFVHGQDGRYLLGAGLGADVFRDATTADDADHGTPSKWNGALVASLASRLTLWRWLRLVLEVQVRAVSGGMTLVVGEDLAQRTYEAGHWRPGFSLGLEIAK